jgi:hypothetical protein
VAWVGEGWRSLVEECHGRVVRAYPQYELSAIKQKDGRLCFQAFPHRWTEVGHYWSSVEADGLDAIIEEFEVRSETMCEWCGAHARLRQWRTIELTLCDRCDSRFPDPPWPPPVP